jgi:hypothetical protein
MCTPTLAAIAMVGSAGVSIIGQQSMAAQARDKMRYDLAVLANRQQVISQDIRAETEAELLRQQLLSEAGSVREGQIRVAQAGLGQLVDVGSPLDTTAELAAEVAFKKVVSAHGSEVRKRQFQIALGDIEAAAGATSVRAEQAQVAANFANVGTVLTTGATFGTTFERTDQGKLKFRSRVG